MELGFLTSLPLICILVGILSSVAEGLMCYQCNVFVRGTPWSCDDKERGMKEMDDCVSCLKSYTRTYQHNTFHDLLMTDFTSHLCVKSKEYTRPSGCYRHETSSGYMERCFCHDDLCNGDVRISASALTFALPVLLLVIKRFGYMNL